MSMCLVALVVFAVMSIFSARYRRWAKEAFNCVARRLTLRPCTTGFNDKVKATITGALMKRHMGLARFANRHFEAISWVFTAVMFISLAYTAYGFYNLAVLGTCDPANPQNCVFNPDADPNRVICTFDGLEPEKAVPTIGGFMDIESAIIGSGKPRAYFFGTTWCPHCKWEKPIFQEVTAKFSDYVDITMVEIDVEQPDEEMHVFNHYSPDGYIPLIVFEGKYFRIGAGETLGEDGERQVLTAFLCKITNSPGDITECSQPDITELIGKI
jgi:thiol-disulfide isomerase/thioredoxin